MQQENDFNYNLDIPQKDGAPGYIGVFFTMYLKLATIIQSPEFMKEPIRVFYLLTQMVSMIPEEKERMRIREVIRNNRKFMEQEYKNDGIAINENIKNHVLVTSGLEALGQISDYIDKHVGISNDNKIGWGVNKNKDIIIKGSPIDLRIKDLEEIIKQKDREIELLRRNNNNDTKC